MKKFILNKKIAFELGIIFLILLWWILSLIYDVDNMVLPGPYTTIKSLIQLLSDKAIWTALGSSLIKLLVGFSVSFLMALLIGLFVGNSEKRYEFFKPLMTALKSVPTATIVFLFIVLSNSKRAPMYVVGLVSLPILYEAIVSGLKSVPVKIVEAAELDGADKFNILIKIRLPLSTKAVIVGIVSSFSLSFKIEIMAEVLTGNTQNGLGSLIRYSQQNDPTNMVPIFAYSLLAILLMILVTIFASILKKKLFKVRNVL